MATLTYFCQHCGDPRTVPYGVAFGPCGCGSYFFLPGHPVTRDSSWKPKPYREQDAAFLSDFMISPDDKVYARVPKEPGPGYERVPVDVDVVQSMQQHLGRRFRP